MIWERKTLASCEVSSRRGRNNGAKSSSKSYKTPFVRRKRKRRPATRRKLFYQRIKRSQLTLLSTRKAKYYTKRKLMWKGCLISQHKASKSKVSLRSRTYQRSPVTRSNKKLLHFWRSRKRNTIASSPVHFITPRCRKLHQTWTTVSSSLVVVDTMSPQSSIMNSRLRSKAPTVVAAVKEPLKTRSTWDRTIQ